MDFGHTYTSPGHVFVNTFDLIWVSSLYGAFISLPPPEKVPLVLWPTGSFVSFVITLTRCGNGMLSSLNPDAGGKALLKTAGYSSVDIKKPKSSKEECLEVESGREEL